MEKEYKLYLDKIEDFSKVYNIKTHINIEHIYEENYTIKIENTKDNKKTIVLIEENRERALFSRYNVNNEVERFINQINQINTESLIVMFGFGLGYHIKEIFEKISINNKILIIEPSLEIFLNAMEAIDVKEIFKENTNCEIIVGYDIQAIEDYFYKNIGLHNLNNVHIASFGQYENIFEDYYKEILKKLKEAIAIEDVNLRTEYYFHYDFSGNVIKNIPYLLESKSLLELEKKFEGYPAIIVSAGPSLDKNIHQLKEAQGKSIIISGGRTLKPLLKNGIIPNFVVTIDPGYPAYELLENYLDCDIPLISMIVGSNDIIKKYKGQKFMLNKEPYTELINDLSQREMILLPNGGSVAHTATVIGQYMGCNPVVLIGQDLAFSDERWHSDQAIIEGKENKAETDGLIVEDIYGNDVKTNRGLYSFIDWYNKYFELNKHIKFIDATEGGAKIKGTEILPLKEVIDKYCLKELKNYEEVLSKTLPSIDCYLNALKIAEDVIEDIDIIEKKIIKGEKLLNDMLLHYKNQKKININKILKKIDDIDNLIIDKSDSSVLLTSAVIPSIRKIKLDPSYIEKFGETETEKGIRMVKKTEKLYEGILYAIKFMKPLIKEAIDRINEKIKDMEL